MAFSFWPGLHVQIDASIVKFAKLGVEHLPAVRPAIYRCHAISSARNSAETRGVALWQIETGANATALFATDQNILLQHQFANVLEADGHFMSLRPYFAAILSISFVTENVFAMSPGKLAGTDEMPRHQRENLMRIDKGAVAIDCADAITVAVGSQPSIEFSGEHGLAQERRCAVRWARGERRRNEGSRVPRISSEATPLRVKEFLEQSRRRAVHRIHDKSEFRIAQSLPVDQLSRRCPDKARAVRANESSSIRGGSDGMLELSTAANSVSICATMEGSALLP